MMQGDRSRDPPTYPPGWGGLARKLVLEENTFSMISHLTHALSDGHVDWCGRIRHRRKSSARLFRKLSPTLNQTQPRRAAMAVGSAHG